MIVEDKFATAELLEMVLIDEGYAVVTTANGTARDGQDPWIAAVFYVPDKTVLSR